MATSEEQEVKLVESTEEKTTETVINTEKTTDTESSSPETNDESISMFCKACLHPYSGERKTGNLVLKCERCGQTDIILEDDACELDPEEWCGNLMMNRFMQVLKEQEDLGLNIADPFFAEDEFQRLHMAISEYTFNMKAIAERMYDIAHKAAASLAEFYEQEAKNERENGKRAQDSVVYVLPEPVRRHLKHLGPTVLSLMEDLIQKYELPMEILDNVKERIKSLEIKTEEEKETELYGKTTIIGESNTINFGARVGEQTESDTSESAAGAESVKEKKSENGKKAEANEGDREKDENGEYVIFNVSKSMLEKEVFDALQHKFALKFGTEAKAKNTWEEGEGETEGATASGSNDKEEKFIEDPTKHVDHDVNEARSVLKNVEGLRTYVLETTSDDPSTVDKDRNDEQVIEVNFYAVSSAFINELQERKSKALVDRKDKALATVNSKIKNLKKEVERVEDRVREELTSAYEKKRKKVENQRKQLDDRHKQIQEAERMLDFYARTGQTEKLAELMEQLNVQYEN